MTRTERCIARWERLLARLESAGYVRDHGFGEPPVRSYRTRDDVWYGVGSAYVYVCDEDTGAEVKVRMSDHAEVPGGGLRWHGEGIGHYRDGEADISLHPGSEVTLRNFLARLDETTNNSEA
jgi:hypothetical protein